MNEAELFTKVYRQYAGESTDAPDDYHRVIAYAIMACVSNRNIWFRYGHLKLYPNLYVLLVGPSALNRKSWSMSMGTKLVERIFPDYEIMDCSSFEAFVAELGREDRVPSGCGLLLWDELSSMLGRMEKKSHFEGLEQALTSAYTYSTIRRRRGVDAKESVKVEIREPCLNILTGCSLDWVTKYVHGSDVTGGFLARFLWVICNERRDDIRILPTPVDEAKQERLIHKLDKLSLIQGEVSFTDKGMQAYRDWGLSFRRKFQGGFWDAYYDRLMQMVIKLSMLNALQRREVEVNVTGEGVADFEMTEADVAMAYYLVEDLIPGLSSVVIGDDRAEILLKRVCHWAVSKKVHECRRSDAMNGIRGINAYWMDQIEKTMVDRDLLEVASPNGHKGKLYKFDLDMLSTIR